MLVYGHNEVSGGNVARRRRGGSVNGFRHRPGDPRVRTAEFAAASIPA